MKRIYTILVAVLLTASVFAQAPEKMTYQAVVRDINSDLLINQAVGIRVSILQGDITGSVVYKELFNPNPITNSNGLITLEIGNGVPILGSFSSIEWSLDQYFIKTEIDPTGGTNYTIEGTSQLLSVPYALHAKTAENIIGGINEIDPIYSNWDKSYNDLSNKPNIIDSVTTVLDTTTQFVRNEIDSDITNEIQSLTVSQTGDTLYLSVSNFVIIPGISVANHGGTYLTDTIVSFDNYPSTALAMFGGNGSRAVPYGQSVKLGINIRMNEFAVPFNSGFSQEVDIKLIIRESNGNYINEKLFTISQTYNGGWYSFDTSDLNIELSADTTYVFMLYLVDGITNGISNSVKYDSGGTDIDGGAQYRIIDSYSATNSYIEDWSNWQITGYPNKHYRISGSILPE